MPLQKFPERRPAMAIPRLVLRRKLRESFPNLRKIEKRIIPEAILPTRRIEDDALCRSTEGRQRSAIAGRRQHAHKSPRALLNGHTCQFPQHPRIVLFIG